jgi:hypothetical protein
MLTLAATPGVTGGLGAPLLHEGPRCMVILTLRRLGSPPTMPPARLTKVTV